jgi:hypothetical protein
METEFSKEQIEELKAEWKRLWRDRIDDKFKAEGIANTEFAQLFVEKGTVIFATRNFKMLNFREILEQHGVVDVHRYVQPNPQIGGWGRFIRASITGRGQARRIKRSVSYLEEEKQRQQPKKGGRGWLHI